MIKKIVFSGICGFCMLYMLYKNIWISSGGMIAFALFGVLNKREFEKERLKRIQARFMDFLLCLEPLLKTSGTFSGAFSEAVLDYKRFHGNDEVSKCLENAVNDFRMNSGTSEVLGALAEKLNIEDARAFAGSMAVCESTGGNAVEVTGRTTELLVGRIRILCDINTVLSGKIFEQKIITLMPFLLLGILASAAGSYLEPLYTSGTGRIVMTAAGLLFLTQWLIGKKISDIEV